ncbi:MAG: transferase [Candidatus Eremiobacteraeota bacterium]|nr:transferase [Candidatus Eremiobacteraeota bacterium]
MNEIVIFGAGKVADVVYHHLRRSDEYSVAAFTCDRPYVPEGGRFRDVPVVAFDEVTHRYPPDRFSMIVALGYHELNALRRAKYEEAKAKGYRLATYVSSAAHAGDWLEAGDNCIVLDGAILEPGTRLGNNVVVWSGVLVGHHTTIDDHAWIAGHATFGGSARLGAGSFVGLGAVVGHEVEIGESSFLGAGVLVTKCCDPKSVFVGANTELFRLDSERFLRISKLR